MRIVAAIEGNLSTFLEGEQTALAEGIRAAVNRAGIGLRDDIRGQIRSGFRRARGRPRGQNLEKAVRARIYPLNKSRRSLGPAAFVYLRWEPATIHEEGGTISGRPWLAIPTREAERLGLARAGEDRGSFGRYSRGSRGRSAQIDAAIRRFGGQTVVLDGRNGTKVIGMRPKAARGEGLRVGKRFRGASGKLQKRNIVPLFILVPQVRLRSRLNIKGHEEKWSAQLYREIAAVVS